MFTFSAAATRCWPAPDHSRRALNVNNPIGAIGDGMGHPQSWHAFRPGSFVGAGADPLAEAAAPRRCCVGSDAVPALEHGDAATALLETSCH